MDKIILNRILALPFSAELTLDIPESSVNSLMQDCLDLSYIEEPTIIFHEGYFTFSGNVSMIVTSIKIHLDLEIRGIFFDGTQLIIDFKDHGETISGITKILKFLGSMFSKTLSIEGKVIRIDLSSKISSLMEKQTLRMQNIIKSIRLEKPEITEGSIKLTMKREAW